MNRLGLGQEAMRKHNPSLIYGSISPFGQEGPKSHWPATDLTIEAAGGRLSVQGDNDRVPVPIGFPQAFLHAGAQMAADVLIAINERNLSGEGQYLDLSAMETMYWTLMGIQGSPVCGQPETPGLITGDEKRQAGGGIRILEASDGWVLIAPAATPAGKKNFFTLAVDDAIADKVNTYGLDRIDWNNWLGFYQSGLLSREDIYRVNELLARFVAKRSMLELIQITLEHNGRLGPLFSTKDMLDFEQFRERGLFAEIGGSKHVANWVKLAKTPVSHAPAPAIAKKARQAIQQNSKRRREATPRELNNPSRLAFAGLKVADMSWVAAGPTIGKALADNGATVVKVESATRPDLVRTLGPFVPGGDPDSLNRSYWSFLYATSKLSLQCNLRKPEGLEVARHLCDWADVVIESFSPGTMARFGLDYESLSQDRDDLIMLSTSMLGQSGPFKRYAGYGQQAAGFAGLHYITGWKDRTPCGVASPYTDVIAPKFGIAAISAALHHRKQTGKGQYIDLAQAECASMFIAPFLLDQAINNHTPQRRGTDSLYAIVQGVFRTAVPARFIAISVENDEQWRKLCSALPELGEKFGDSTSDEISGTKKQGILSILESHSLEQQPFDLEMQLISAGVPASVVLSPHDFVRDPQIQYRDFMEEVEHDECGNVVHFGSCTQYSTRKTSLRSSAPCIGAHTEYVLQDLLELDQSEIARYRDAGALI